ncbi:hypothetical protein GALMADRAFT_212979 [Galerina marginata CBS 339.88]|uniref:Uncharacterized protein n=1 Tax=Galerina marginata (strain CBS 339.88) TaxID=685588 RepID=A0A067SZC6_GALM3|nr:hypothetical protein GALMADRAFT_212979 [Galerina marginata CBS 339.88]
MSLEPVSSTPAKDSGSNTNRPTRPLRYEIKVFVNNSLTGLVKYDQVPIALCSMHPPEVPTKMFLVQLVKKYDREIMDHQAWVCWNCSSPAVGMVHTPASYLHLEEPEVIDYAQPVCINGGPCDVEARKVMAEKMKSWGSR